jgi:hypothetical protein
MSTTGGTCHFDNQIEYCGSKAAAMVTNMHHMVTKCSARWYNISLLDHNMQQTTLPIDPVPNTPCKQADAPRYTACGLMGPELGQQQRQHTATNTLSIHLNQQLS